MISVYEAAVAAAENTKETVDMSYIKSHGLILPHKEKWTMKDVRKLERMGASPTLATFIILCSAIDYLSDKEDKVADTVWRYRETAINHPERLMVSKA